MNKPPQTPSENEDLTSTNPPAQEGTPNWSQVISARQRATSMLSRSQDALMCSFAGNYDLEVSPEETILLTTKPHSQLPEILQKKVTEAMMYRHWGDYPLINQKDDPNPNLDQYQEPEQELEQEETL